MVYKFGRHLQSPFINLRKETTGVAEDIRVTDIKDSHRLSFKHLNEDVKKIQISMSSRRHEWQDDVSNTQTYQFFEREKELGICGEIKRLLERLEGTRRERRHNDHLLGAKYRTTATHQLVFPDVLLDEKYGDESEQVMDLYLPASGANSVTKCILLIHGGAWYKGNKTEMKRFVPIYQKAFPHYAIANINYRLASRTDPANPKQLVDIDTAVNYIRSKTTDRVQFAMVGVSAGGHLAMMYGYKMDEAKRVKVVVDYVGPADLSAWTFAINPNYNSLIQYYVGPYSYWDNPGAYYEGSPVAWVNTTSPPTIGFYGTNDPLIPSEQMPLLKKRLDQAKITNEFHRYPGGHFDWEQEYLEDSDTEAIAFMKRYL